MTDISKKIYHHIKDNFSDRICRTSLKVSKFKVDGVNCKDLTDIVNSREVLKATGCVDDFVFLSDAEKSKIISEVSTWFYDSLAPKFQNSAGIKTKAHFLELTPCLDLESKDGEYFMLSNKTGWISKITYRSWERAVSKEYKEQALNNTIFATKKYMPYSLDKYIKVENAQDHEGEECIVNTCIQPNWRYRDEDIKLDNRFLNFFDSLFTNQESKQYAIDWIYESIYGRNSTYLVLCGRKGIGKNILAEALSYMVGLHNYNEAPRSALTKEFNSYLKDKRLVLMDEISFRESKEKDKLKSYLNNFQAVEGKGKDARMIELHCSIILSSNNAKDMNIEPDDRRFSVMDLTDVPLMDTIGESGIEDLIEYIRSADFPLAFNQWLQSNRSTDYVPSRPFKGDTFNELCITTLTTWQIAIYDAVMSREKKSYKVSDLMDMDNRRYFPKRHKDYQTFLENFTINGKTIGFYDRGMNVNDSEIVPNSEYSPISVDDLD